ncbi:hypothetical protein EMIT0324P_110090 [Pseudomonas chlororaphis]
MQLREREGFWVRFISGFVTHPWLILWFFCFLSIGFRRLNRNRVNLLLPDDYRSSGLLLEEGGRNEVAGSQLHSYSVLRCFTP